MSLKDTETRTDAQNEGSRWQRSLLDGQNETNDETVQSQSLGENEDENHTSEEEGLLSVGANSSVSDDTNGHTGSETSQTDRETRSEMSESLVGSVLSGAN